MRFTRRVDVVRATVPVASGATLAGRRWAACLLAVGILASVLAQAASANWTRISPTPSKTEPYLACPPQPSPGRVACQAIVDPTPMTSVRGPLPAGADQSATSPALEGGGIGGGFSPADLRSAYNLPSTSGGSGQTVAIVDAYDDPNAEADLAQYRISYAGIPACTTGNGCFKKVNQTGGTTYPEANKGWAVEISLDLDMVSAICPYCHIVLVEATNSELRNLAAAENEAAALGATEISNSWVGGEYSGDTEFNWYFAHSGVPIAAAAGDSGYQVNYPASSPNVIAVGGTTLTKASNARGWAETVWYDKNSNGEWVGTGSGCSAYEAKPAWQSDTGCARRTNNDVAAVADQNTPVSGYDSYGYSGEERWRLFGGTSAATPIIASAMALANAYTRSFPGAEAFYVEALQNGTGVLDDVSSGSNGGCGSYLCNAQPGYDGPTGLGSPYGAPTVSQTPPTVTTGATTGIKQTEATLNGTLNPNGPETHYRFEYGTTTSYGSSTPEVDAGFGVGSKPESSVVVGLQMGVTYHYRVTATNSAGTSYGSDSTFTTPLPSNGSFWRVSNGVNAGEILVAAGNALLTVTECGHLNGCTGYVEITSELETQYKAAHPTIANGTLVKVANGANEGEVSVAAGGAIVQIDECAGPFNCGSAVSVDSKGLGYYKAEHPTIANGTLVNVANGANKGEVSVAAGGAIVQIDECAGPFNCGSAVYVGSKGLGYYKTEHPTIANGTFVRVANGSNVGEISVAAGGAVLRVNECKLLSECIGYVNVGSKGLGYYKAEHPTIANGTYLFGVPSKTTWVVNGGKREEAGSNQLSVSVTDVMLESIPIG